MTAAGVRPVSGPAPDWLFPSFERHTLSNGVQVIACHLADRPVIHVRLLTDGGIRREPAAVAGLGHITGRSLLEGSELRRAEELNEALEVLGARLDVGVAWNGIATHLTMPRSQLLPALELLAEVATAPGFRDDDVRGVVRRRIDETVIQQRVPHTAGMDAFAAAVFPDGARMALPKWGAASTVATLDAGMAERWWRLHAQPFTSTVLVVGDLRDVDLDALLGKTFEPWVTTQPALSPPALDPLGAARRGIVVDLPQGVQTTLCVGLASPPCALADRAALQVATHVLGGYFGSRLVTRLREEKSITYGVNAQMNNRKGSSVFLLTTAVEVPATLEALTDIFDEIASVAGGVGFGDDEVRKAADNLIGRGPIAYKNAAAVADTLQSIVLNDLPDDYVDRHRADMAELTPGQVTEAFRRHVDVDRLAVAAAGPAAAITDPIRSLIPGVFVR